LPLIKNSKAEENYRTKEKEEWKKPCRNALDKSDRKKIASYEGRNLCPYDKVAN
jgi:hypothetical protein